DVSLVEGKRKSGDHHAAAPAGECQAMAHLAAGSARRCQPRRVARSRPSDLLERHFVPRSARRLASRACPHSARVFVLAPLRQRNASCLAFPDKSAAARLVRNGPSQCLRFPANAPRTGEAWMPMQLSVGDRKILIITAAIFVVMVIATFLLNRNTDSNAEIPTIYSTASAGSK